MRVSNPLCNSCFLFHDIAIKVWRDIIYAHMVYIDESEVGLTKKIIVELKHFHKKCNTIGLDVYAKSGYKEEIYGSDIDLFVEISPNQYVWYALQSKVLKLNKTYTTLRDGYSPRNRNYQWEKLTLLEGLTGCKSYYLLYNGVEDFDYRGLDFCSISFNESQFGCSLVEPKIIENYALKTDARGHFISPTFDDLHPNHAQPWRVLVCCPKQKSTLTKYKLETILESNKDLGFVKTNSSNDESESNGKDSNMNQKSFNKITEGISESKWKPDYRIIYSNKNLQ
ncbi:hypothetical protein [Flavobacterium lacus]|uniref:Uncharacterized protein n=1 Tax=Flavobacterium lacus TaxID=1353778 RepID=A0A328WJQ4_9FLAO|nr:hypothetical protein [Flavobacterium lacus]RAR46451.1 hypothetical protein B0I10_11910 [Flavobacterium lacus]